MNPKLNELARIVKNPGWLCMAWFGMTARSKLIVAGIEPKPSITHAACATTELLKLALLWVTGLRSLMTHPPLEHFAP